MQEAFEVLFCDLCNSSVPLTDIESGAAKRLGAQTIGACCLHKVELVPGGELRTPAAAAAAPVALSAPAAKPGTASPGTSVPVPAGGLAVGLVLLVAIAAAVLFLDKRLSDDAVEVRAEFEKLKGESTAQAGLLADLQRRGDAQARQAELDALARRVATQEEARALQHQELLVLVERQRAATAAVEARLAELVAGRVDPGPQLQELRQLLQQQSLRLAELAAAPRQDPSTPTPVITPPAEPAVTGLPPELAHHVARLADGDPATRFEAVDALLRSNHADVRPHLLGMAKDADPFVRRLTVEGLRAFKQADVVEVLLVALADPEEIVADTAWRSLQVVTGQNIPFDASGSREQVRRAQERWQEWWAKNKATFGSGAGGSGTGGTGSGS